MEQKRASYVRVGAWLLAAALVIAAGAAWAAVRLADGYDGAYELYPLLGLVAYSMMWTHYIVGSARRIARVSSEYTRRYFTMTSWIVLICILLHPGILWFLLWRDGLGLPPFSYLGLYTSLTMRAALILGSLSLIAFLLFDIYRRYKDKSWWRFIEYANVAAMFAIFYHGLVLGAEISGWYQVLWLLMGITLAISVRYNYYSTSTKEDLK